MSRRRPADDGLLFDLPLEPPPARRAPAEAAGGEAPDDELEQPALPLEAGDHPPASTEALEPHLDEPPGEGRIEAFERRRGPAAGPGPATLGPRVAAGLTDLGVCAAVLIVLLVALLAQGVRPELADWPAAALFLLAFSFLYSVLPLAFWGRTPGMALAGLRSASADGRPLTFRQAVLVWLGGVLTVVLAGLPLLLALGGRSLSDLMSGSRTGRQDVAP